MIKRFARLRALSWPDRALLAEALVVLSLAALAVALAPFRTIDRFAGRPSRSAPPRDARQAIARVAWAVRAGARRAPLRAKCFEQGLAAAWMLRRRGVSTLLHYGAAREDDNLVAHVWVTAGDDDVIGCENKDRFAELVRLGKRERLARNRSG
jgi:hypothetical protein